MKFKVLVSRTYHSSKIYEVNAKSEEDAVKLAEDKSFDEQENHLENVELIELHSEIYHEENKK